MRNIVLILLSIGFLSLKAQEPILSVYVTDDVISLQKDEMGYSIISQESGTLYDGLTIKKANRVIEELTMYSVKREEEIWEKLIRDNLGDKAWEKIQNKRNEQRANVEK